MVARDENFEGPSEETLAGLFLVTILLDTIELHRAQKGTIGSEGVLGLTLAIADGGPGGAMRRLEF